MVIESVSALPDAAHRPSSRDLPSLDGLRALSIGLVIVGHWASGHASASAEFYLGKLAYFGVLIFFVISGYLITTLLWREADKYGAVSLPRFYLRRTLRIFPPFYTYVTAIAVLAALGAFALPTDTRFWPAFAYLTNFFSTNTSLLQHSWSLSLEEQFYLTWPITLSFLLSKTRKNSTSRAAKTSTLLVLLAFPILLRVTIFALTRLGWLAGQFIFDYVAAGSAIALFESAGDWRWGRHQLQALMQSPYTPIAAIAALVLHLVFTGSIRWWFAVDMVVLTPLKAILLAVFVVWAVRNPSHIIGRMLNWRVARIVGVGSYSLYLWQQLFFGPGSPFAVQWHLAAKFSAMCVCAVASYWIVEQPSLRLRARLESSIFGSRLPEMQRGGLA